MLTDKELLGGVASLDMPFYGAFVLVVICFGMVLVFFKDVRKEHEPFAFRPVEVFESLWRVTQRPLVLKLMPAFACFMVANVTFYIFVDNYLTSAFGYGTIGGSVAFLIIGIAVAFSGRYLVGPAQQRFDKQWIVGASLVVMMVSAIAYIASPVAALCYVPVFAFYLLFGVSYPTLLGLFSSSVSKDDQGWVMGVTVAVFTLAGGIMSLIGGGLMDVNIRLPFYVVIGTALLGLVFVTLTWGNPDIRKLTHKLAAVSG